MENKYEMFIQLLNFNKDKYSAEKIFKDFISLFAISLSNKVIFSEENSKKYEDVWNLSVLKINYFAMKVWNKNINR